MTCLSWRGCLHLPDQRYTIQDEHDCWRTMQMTSSSSPRFHSNLQEKLNARVDDLPLWKVACLHSTRLVAPSGQTASRVNSVSASRPGPCCPVLTPTCTNPVHSSVQLKTTSFGLQGHIHIKDNMSILQPAQAKQAFRWFQSLDPSITAVHIKKPGMANEWLSQAQQGVQGERISDCPMSAWCLRSSLRMELDHHISID